MVRWEVPPERRVAFTIVLVVVALSVAVTYFVDFRVGGYILAAGLLTIAFNIVRRYRRGMPAGRDPFSRRTRRVFE